MVRASSGDSTGSRNKDYRADVTYWIDKHDLVFRKIRNIYDSSAMVSKNFRVPSHSETTETYTVAEIAPATTAEMFRFTPPADAKEVASLDPDYGGAPLFPHQKTSLVGQMAPEVSFAGGDGKKVEMSSDGR